MRSREAYEVPRNPSERTPSYVARCLELPGAFTQGETEEETLANIQDAILTIIDLM